ncbi:MAG: hypothetical protein ABIJ56_10790 [Pseudomonadota bacterium]
MRQEKIIDSTRLRTHEGSFAYIPHRFLRGGFYAACTVAELSVYLLLVLAADRNGVSFYSRARMSLLTGLDLDRLERILASLDVMGLIAREDTYTQVLALPAKLAKRGGGEGSGGPRQAAAVSVAEALHAFTRRLQQKTAGR